MTMSIEDLRDVIIKCAGGDADALPVDRMSVSFEELGYDSLVLIETSATLKREYGVVIPDEQLTELRTPAELLLLINDQLAPAAVAGRPATGI
ncbi:acyl carrier protein [Amycolatopsis sp. NPDC051102]|uniref:acyl carrier protein n=1 Tax=Amycolatopsis sp. NPDC051102 TaxID=3155163 RepID=UPI00344742F9